MKNNIIIFLFLFSIMTFGQNFENIKKLDTIFIKFNGNRLQKRFLGKINENPNRFYRFIAFTKGKRDVGFSFSNFKFKLTKANMIIETEVKFIDKSFIKINKNKIIGSKFFKKYEMCEIENQILNGRKVFYIIDLKEKIKGKIKVYEVFPSQNCNIEDDDK